MGRASNKRERLDAMERLIMDQPWKATDLARHFGVSRETIYQDLENLERVIPLEQDPTTKAYWIDKSRYLSNVRLNVEEKLIAYLAARRHQRHTLLKSKAVSGMLSKLARSLNHPMTERLVAFANAVLDQEDAPPEQEERLAQILKGWLHQQVVEIVYEGLESKEPYLDRIHIYLMEPSPWGEGTYLIAYSTKWQKQVSYKLERVQKAFVSGETYAIHPNFDEQHLQKVAWGIWQGQGNPQRVHLRFYGKRAIKRVRESVWHPSVQFIPISDTTLDMVLDLSEPREMLPWIRGWGADAEVLEPAKLRREITKEIRRFMQMYGMRLPSDSPSVKILRYWGKAGENSNEYHPAIFHMIDVGHVAKVLLKNGSLRWSRVLAQALGTSPDEVKKWLPFFVSLHDILKLSAPFQVLNIKQVQRLAEDGITLEVWQAGGNRHHSVLGQAWLQTYLTEKFPDMPHTLKQIITEMVGGHHGKYHRQGDVEFAQREFVKYDHPHWKEIRKQAIEILYSHFANSSIELWGVPSNISTAVLALTGFTILCDWLGSNSDWFPPSPNSTLEDYFAESLAQAQQAVEEAGLITMVSSVAPTNFEALFPDKSPPRPLQSAIDEIPNTLLQSSFLAIIESPPGEGKTEAGLTLAHRRAVWAGTDELYYALPSMATSNQMYRRMQFHLVERLGLSDNKVRLIHGQAFLLEDDLTLNPSENEDPETKRGMTEWLDSTRRALVAPFGVGTIDQAELGGLNVKFHPLRLVGLAGKVLILDEVHAYDTYMTTIIERLLEWCAALGITVILLSATLPLKRRARLAKAYGVSIELDPTAVMEYPSLWVGSAAGTRHTTPPAQATKLSIRIGHLEFGDDEAGILGKAQWLLAQVKGGGCACWITNTVGRAQKLFSCLQALIEKDPSLADVALSILHARYPLEDRQALEKTLNDTYGPTGERPYRGIVVGTQVLEQSLDLDFDVMVSDLAPIDLLLQRSGRVHRHRRTRPEAHESPRLWVNTRVADNGLALISGDKRIYAPYIMQVTWQVIKQYGETWTFPEFYRPLVEAVYDAPQPAKESLLHPLWKELAGRETQARGIANERLLPDPTPDDSYARHTTRMVFDEGNEDEQATWTVAQTRLGEESITVIPLEKLSSTTAKLPDGTIIDLTRKTDRLTALRLLRRNLRMSDPTIIHELHTSSEPTPLFRDTPRLRGYHPLWLTQNRALFKEVTVELDTKIGLVLHRKEPK